MAKKDDGEKYVMENVVSPGHTTRVDAAKFMAMKAAVLAVLPSEAPGITPAELRERITPILSQEHFPGGEKAGWWMKGVQLDLEAKGTIARGSPKPVKLYKL
ncbi:hypothetical protein [Devosia sp. 2618]|uniref:DUF6958 family protein n=1 Tax=Devosia sp. 2618 TaxID=3156454 RepID=UPI003393B7E8